MNSNANVPPGTRVPPRFVPTLTEVVPTSSLPHPSGAVSGGSAPVPAEPQAAELGQQILHRVMQRVDAKLSQTLRQAVAELVLNHTQLLTPLIREEIELVVRQAVNDAVAQELQGPSV